MTHEEASARCLELNADQTRTRQWFVTQAGPGDWEIASVAATGIRPRGPLKGAVEARPRPHDPPDVRPSLFRNIPPYGA